MQLKTIRKNIEMKLEQWLSTITDEPLRKKLKSQILVSGGSITSMFLNEPVNDYDIYIMNHDTLIQLCEYYIKPFGNKIQIFDGQNKKQNTGNNIGGLYGTSLRTLKEDQIKLYFEEKNGGMKVNENRLKEKIKLNSNKETFDYFPVFFSPNAISLSDSIQIITRFHGNAETIHKTFDFVHATNYFTFNEGLVTNKAALESILTKQLKYQGSLYPLTTIIRIKKFVKRGWNITAGEILKVMFQVSQFNLKDPDVLEDQLIGIDIAYFSKLIEILRGIDNPDITSSYLNTIIDKVFDGAEEINDEL